MQVSKAALVDNLIYLPFLINLEHLFSVAKATLEVQMSVSQSSKPLNSIKSIIPLYHYLHCHPHHHPQYHTQLTPSHPTLHKTSHTHNILHPHHIQHHTKHQTHTIIHTSDFRAFQLVDYTKDVTSWIEISSWEDHDNW